MELLRRKDVPVYPSTLRLIKSLAAAGIKRACISSSRNCRAILEKIPARELFDVVVDGNVNLPGKPRPDIFLRAARDLAAEAKECVVFEDAVLGVKAAKAAGMFCVGIDRYGDRRRLQGADKIVGDLEEIGEIDGFCF